LKVGEGKDLFQLHQSHRKNALGGVNPHMPEKQDRKRGFSISEDLEAGNTKLEAVSRRGEG